MPGPSAGFKGKVAITTAAATATDADILPNVRSFTFPVSRAKIDASNAKDGAADASRRAILGLLEGDPTISLMWDEANAICQRLRAARDGDTSVWVQYSMAAWGASSGEKMECKVQGIEKSFDPDGALVANVTLTPNGAPAVL